jgi:Holliday junction resolvasome RuvABC endonuclease subunit
VILGVDPGYASCGWAVITPRTGLPVAIGVIETEQNKRVEKSTDRARRVSEVGRELVAIARQHGCTRIAAEQALGHGAAAAVAANLLPWGVLVGIAVTLDIELYEVPAKIWQHAVLPGLGKGKVDYDELARHLLWFAHKHCSEALAAIAKPKRTHAIDGMGVGMFAALRTATSITTSSTCNAAPAAERL